MKDFSSIGKFIFLILSSPVLLPAQNNLNILDPRFGGSQKGTIEEASITIRNKGLFIEYGLYLSFSSRGTSYKSADSLEVVLNFTLPAKSIVTDSWLWIGEDICRAKILDVFTASNIYENIVRRRRDPSLLLKNSETSYTLRIFPLVGNEIRRVKITYMVPLIWSEDKAGTAMPSHILNTSRFIPSKFPILVWNHPDWINPSIDKNPFGFADNLDSLSGPYKSTTLYPGNAYEAMNISYDNPMKNGYYLCYYPDKEESYYQIALKPGEFTDQIKPQKMALLLDYQSQSNAITKQELSDQLKAELKKTLTDQDSFNVFYSNLATVKVFQTWMPATDSMIDSAFQSIEHYLLNFSNLPNLLATGIEFINEQRGDAKILLCNNSDQFASYEASNDLLKLIQYSNTYKTPIHILDYIKSSKSFQVNGRTYYNNEYLFINICNLTGGYYNSIRSGKSFPTAVSESITQCQPRINGFDLFLKVQNGITYGRYTLSNEGENPPASGIITQTGVFRGLFPIHVEMSGEIQRNIFYTGFDIPETQTTKMDSTVKTCWQAQGIQKQEFQNNSNAVIHDLIYKSIQNRILTRYTAFLCIEDSTLYCQNCRDETEISVSSEDKDRDSIEIKAFPNPFSDQLTIELHFTSELNASDWNAAIFDLTGKPVHQFKFTERTNSGLPHYTWNANSTSGKILTPGAYILTVYSKEKRYHRKLMKF